MIDIDRDILSNIIYKLILKNINENINEYSIKSILKGIKYMKNKYYIINYNDDLKYFINECNKIKSNKIYNDKDYKLGILISSLSGICSVNEKFTNKYYNILSQYLNYENKEYEFCNCGNGNCVHILKSISILQKLLINFNYDNYLNYGYYEALIDLDFYNNIKNI